MKEIINNYKQEIQYLKNQLIKKRNDSKSKNRTDQAKSFKDQNEKDSLIYLLLYLKCILIIV